MIVLKTGLDILGPGRFRPGPPRILKTLEVVHRISSVSRGLAPFPLCFPNSPRLESSFKRTVINGGFVILVLVSVDLSLALKNRLIQSFGIRVSYG